MLIIDTQISGGLEKALKLLKKKFANTGVVAECRDRQYYTKPSVRRRDEIKRGVYRTRLRQDLD